jgi:nitroreductase
MNTQFNSEDYFQSLVEKREACRDFSSEVVSRENLIEIVNAARLAPSACNSQPWKMIIVDGEKAKEIPPALQSPERSINHFTNYVSSFIVICETKAVLMKGATCDSQYYAQMDIGIIAAHLTLAAASKGISTCIMGAIQEPGIKKILSVPDDVKVRLVVAVGYARTDDLRTKSRKEFNEVVSINNF